MIIDDLYARYSFCLPPNLEEHQKEIAARGYAIYEALDEKTRRGINLDNLITSLLIHDMGNLAKFNLKKFPILNDPQHRDWPFLKQEFIKKYGANATKATYKIAQEIGATDEVTLIISNMGFENASKAYQDGDLTTMIALFSDQHNLKGILSGRTRYMQRQPFSLMTNWEKIKDTFSFMKNYLALQLIQKGIFNMAVHTIDVSDQSLIESYINRINQYELTQIK